MPTVLSATSMQIFIISLVAVTVILTARQIRLMLAALQANQQQQLELVLAKEKNAFMAEFLANISHDLKTPLAIINTNIYMLEHLKDPERQREKLRRIEEQTQLVNHFIEDILTVSRLEYIPDLELTTVDVNTLLRDIERQLRPRVEHKKIQLTMSLEDKLPPIRGDNQQLARAFMNLVENAIHYTRDTGRVMITSRAETQRVVITIEDTGIGIADEDLPHVFERFYRAKAAQDLVHNGTGLGLAIVQKIIEKHAGEICVESHLNQGTTFQVSLSLPNQG